MSLVDDLDVWRLVGGSPPDQKARHLVDRSLGGRQPDPQDGILRNVLEALEAQRQVRPPARKA